MQPAPDRAAMVHMRITPKMEKIFRADPFDLEPDIAKGFRCEHNGQIVIRLVLTDLVKIEILKNFINNLERFKKVTHGISLN
jgi:hypothetical protein